MRDLTIAWRMLGRDWRSGELRILALALIIATASVSSVGFFVDRIEQALAQQAAELLAADLVVVSASPISNRLLDETHQLNLEQAMTTSFRSVVLANDQAQLIEIKAVTQDYPLRGELKVSLAPFAAVEGVKKGPGKGEIWVESQLLQILSLSMGDSLSLGRQQLMITRVLVSEPDRGGDMFSIAPRAIISMDDLDSTGLIGVGSLVKYRLLVAGQQSVLERFRQQIEPLNSQNNFQILTIKDGRPEIRSALDRAQRFLGLAALLSVFLAGVAIATATRRFTRRHLDTSAILRCFGATQHRILKLFTVEMLLLSCFAITCGCLLGYASQFVISHVLDRFLFIQLPEASLRPMVTGFATGLILLVGFAIPPLLTLKQVSPLRVLRRDMGVVPVQVWLLYSAVVLSIAILMLMQTGELMLVIWMLLGLFLTLALLMSAAYGLVAMLRHFRQRVGSGWRFGLANIVRRPISSIIQIVALGIGLMVMLLMSIVRMDLLQGWENSLPDDAPNHFLINIQTDQVDSIRKYLTNIDISDVQLYPMVRSRLLRINEHLVNADDYDDERAQHLVAREFNLSWATNMQTDNHMVSGRWWNDSEAGQSLISLEQGIAKALGIQLHDSLTFAINGAEQDFKVESIRTVDWDSFNVNFFTVVAPGVLDPQQASWVTSVYFSPGQKRQLAQLVRLYPNVTVIDVAAIMARVRIIIKRVTLAVEFIFLFTLLAGLVVLFAAIQSSQDERHLECAILRTIGAQRRTLLASLVAEFVTLGAVAGLLAGTAAIAISWVLAEAVFHFPFELNLSVLLYGLLLGVGVVGTVGIVGTRSVLNQPPLLTLRSL